MLAAAIVEDLLTIAAELQHQPVPTLVLVDEFSAIARAASCASSAAAAPPASACCSEPRSSPTSAHPTTARSPTRTSTERTDMFLGASSPTGNGTRTRTREFVIHPDTTKRLPTGTAAVTSPGHTEPRITQTHHPREARSPDPTTPPRCSGSTRRCSPPPRLRSCSPSSPSWIYEAVRAGTLPCLRIGRHIRFTRAMLEEWLRGRVA
jgi:excisionase family DNA binding protein